MPSVQLAQGYALMANFLAGYKRSFLCCFLVFRFSSCLLSLRRMARVFLGRRSRGLYFLPCLPRHTAAELRHCSELSSSPAPFPRDYHYSLQFRRLLSAGKHECIVTFAAALTQA